MRYLPQDEEGPFAHDLSGSLVGVHGHGGAKQVVGIILLGAVSMHCRQERQTKQVGRRLDDEFW